MRQDELIVAFTNAGLKVTRSPILQELADTARAAETLHHIGVLNEVQLHSFQNTLLEAIRSVGDACGALSDMARIINKETSAPDSEWPDIVGAQ